MRRVLTAKTTELLELQTLRRFLLVFSGDVVAIFAITTLQNDVVSHNWSLVIGHWSFVLRPSSFILHRWHWSDK
jgi:hypothetical protein